MGVAAVVVGCESVPVLGGFFLHHDPAISEQNHRASVERWLVDKRLPCSGHRKFSFVLEFAKHHPVPDRGRKESLTRWRVIASLSVSKPNPVGSFNHSFSFREVLLSG